MIRITRSIAISEGEVHEDFVRASGPGGQNVNKVATAVQLRFDVRSSPSLPEDVRERLIEQAGARITADGVLIIVARRFRTQERNREDALGRFVEMIRRAARKPKSRRRTRPTQASRRRRLEGKRRASKTKQLRGKVPPGEDEGGGT